MKYIHQKQWYECLYPNNEEDDATRNILKEEHTEYMADGLSSEEAWSLIDYELETGQSRNITIRR